MDRIAGRLAVMMTAGIVLCAAPAHAGISDRTADAVLGKINLQQSQPNIVDGSNQWNPQGALVDPSTGRLYVADTANNRVLWWEDPAAAASHATADGVLGQADLDHGASNRGGSCSALGLSSPIGLAVDAVGNLWVADSGNNRVLRFAIAGMSVGAAASMVIGESNFTDNANYGPFPTSLKSPTAVAIDSVGNLWVADSQQNRVVRYSSGTLASGVAADMVLGQADLTSSSANRGGAAAANTVRWPGAVAIDPSDGVWVADTLNNRVLHYSSGTLASGVAADMVLGQADLVSASANRGGAVAANTVSSPTAVTADLSGNIYVSDIRNNRIVRYSSGTLASGVAADMALGQADLVSGSANRGGSPGAATLSAPMGIAIGAGRIFACDSSNNRVLSFTAAGLSTGDSAGVVLGQRVFTRATINDVDARSVHAPFSVAVSTTTGRVFAADTSNHRVLWWNSPGGFQTGAPADGVLGQADDDSNTANRGGAVAANTLNAPAGVALDQSDNLWVCDALNHRVLRYPSATLSTGMNADVALGQADLTSGSSNRGGAAGQNTLNRPYGVAIDSAGAVLVSDCYNSRILRFPASGLATGVNADLVLGQASYSGSGGGIGPASLQYPIGICVDAAGNVWSADYSNSRVVRFPGATLATGMSADLALGQANLTSNGPNRSNPGDAAAANTLKYPYGVSCLAGDIWVADYNNSRVLRYPGGSLSMGMDADLVLGQADFTGKFANRAGPAAANTLAQPSALTMDAGGYVWIVDRANNRVVLYAGLSVSGITPARAINTGTMDISDIAGNGFGDGMAVSIVLGTMSIAGTAVTAVSASSITCRLDLTGAATGFWDLVVSRGSASVTRSGAFEVYGVPITPASSAADVNSDGILDYAYNTDGSAANGYEDYSSVNTTATVRVDGDGDGKFDFFISTVGTTVPEMYWDPDHGILKPLMLMDLNSDATLDWVYDSNGDDLPDKYYDPAGAAVNPVPFAVTDLGGDGIPEYAFNTDGNAANGFEEYRSANTTATVRVDGDGDGKYDYFISTAGSALPEMYWDPDNMIISTVTYQDLNVDGTPDWVFDSNGDGLPDMYYDPVGALVAPASVAVADVNGDGIRDYAYNTDGNAANGYEDYRSVNTTMTVRVDGDGDGKYDFFISTIAAASVPEVYWDPDHMVISGIVRHDLNADGTLDWVYDSNGDGLLDRYYERVGLTVNPVAVVTADVNRDATTDYAYDLDGNAANGYEDYRSVNTTVTVRIDGDADGKYDLFISSAGTAAVPEVYWDPDHVIISTVTSVDASGDGTPDWLYDSSGDGLADRYYDTVGLAVHAVGFVTADVNGDGIVDYAFNADGNAANGYENYSGAATALTLAADLDGDGKFDFFISTAAGAGEPEVYWDPDSMVISAVTRIDVNNDGTQDWLYDSTGDGQLDMYYDPLGLATHPLPFVTADVNGDGVLDHAYSLDSNAANGYEEYRSVNTTATLRMDGDGDGKYDFFISTAGDTAPEMYWDPDSGILRTVILRDLDGDGLLEWFYDANGDGLPDSSYDPSSGVSAAGAAVSIGGLAGPVFMDLDGDPANGYESFVDPTNGSASILRLDADRDGKSDFLIDTNGDGIPDTFADPDGNLRSPVRVFDYNGDGIADWGIDMDGDGRFDRFWRRASGPLVDVMVITDEQAFVPAPNPFYPARGTAAIVYDMAHAGAVTIDVYDVAGELVTVLVNGDRPAGRHQVRWTGANGEYDAADGETVGYGGNGLATGVYMMRFKLGGRQFIRKLAVVR